MFDINKCPKDKDGNLLAQTTDERPVTIITTKGREPYPLVGYTQAKTIPSCWSAAELINLPEPKRSGEVWVYGVKADNGTVRCWNADMEPKGNDLVFKHKHPWTEGEGLKGK